MLIYNQNAFWSSIFQLEKWINITIYNNFFECRRINSTLNAENAVIYALSVHSSIDKMAIEYQFHVTKLLLIYVSHCVSQFFCLGAVDPCEIGHFFDWHSVPD